LIQHELSVKVTESNQQQIQKRQNPRFSLLFSVATSPQIEDPTTRRVQLGLVPKHLAGKTPTAADAPGFAGAGDGVRGAAFGERRVKLCRAAAAP